MNLFLLLEKILGQHIECRYLPGRNFDVSVSVLSSELAREEMGWTPKVPLEKGIENVIKWMSKTLEK